jgi:hypothetical protein
MNKSLRSIFKIWNFLPLFQMLFLWLNKTPPQWNLLLVFKRVLRYWFWEYYFLPLLNIIRYQFEIYQLKIMSFFKKIRWWCGPFALGSCSLPLWHKSPKTESLEPLITTFYPLANKIWVKIIPKMESCSEWRWRMSYGVEAFVFAEDSNSLSIHLWLGLKFTWKHISHST